MGAWGYGPFDNDDAGTACERVALHVETLLREALERGQEEDLAALAYVGILLRLRVAPSTREFGIEVTEKLVANFNAPVVLQTRVVRLQRDGTATVDDSGLPAGAVRNADGSVLGRHGDTWDEPEKRLAVIRHTLAQWRGLDHGTLPSVGPGEARPNPR